ncbi:MAG: hypothetical protein RML12_07315 [Xanthomonadales bacterium]|nr:hypothetical protein [Xanthomonadales bacterium]
MRTSTSKAARSPWRTRSTEEPVDLGLAEAGRGPLRRLPGLPRAAGRPRAAGAAEGSLSGIND